MSKEQRLKISMAHIGMKASDEAKVKMSLAKKGKPSWNKGKDCPWAGDNGFKKGVSSWNKGVPMSEDARKKLSESKKGKTSPRKGAILSEETRKKISLSRKGIPSVNKGKPMSDEQKLKISYALRGKTQNEEAREKNRKSQYRNHFKNIPDYVPDKWLDRRKKLIKSNGGIHSELEWENLKSKHNNQCVNPSCGKKEPEIKLTRDHIIPVSYGGRDDILNIQPLCKSCNSKKHTLTIKYQ